VDTRRRLFRHRAAVTVVAVLASGWALWLMRDRPALSAALGLFCVALLLIGLRKPAAHAIGTLQVDDLGRPFWRSSPSTSASASSAADLNEPSVRGMVVSQWQRTDGSAWLRLLPEAAESQSGAQTMRIDLAVRSSDTSPEIWAALQRWLVWLERGQSR